MKKPKILLLSDDMRYASGIATISKALVLGTVDKYDWVQLGAAINHKDKGKILDVSKDIQEETGIKDANVKIYGSDGYGNIMVLRELLTLENPDIIIHFTDPRFWDWLYVHEREIRQTCPIGYLNIWDSLPDPQYNDSCYSSCDLLMSISKQTYGINKRVLDRYEDVKVFEMDYEDIPKHINNKTILKYVPHGLDENTYYKITEDDEQFPNLLKFKEERKSLIDGKFVIGWNNRNIRRKQPGDVILSYKLFVDKLVKVYGEEVKDKVILWMKTSPIDPNGTDLYKVKESICPNYDIIFDDSYYKDKEQNLMYNCWDVCINITSNEGFGLTTLEALLSGCVTVLNCTGGLQDQIGIKDNKGNYLTERDYSGDWGSNHNKRYTSHGSWCKPVYPTNRSLQGSPQTPYIFDDRCDQEDVANRLVEWYETTKQFRDQCNLEGLEFVKTNGLTRSQMCDKFSEGVDKTLECFVPRTRYNVIHFNEYKKNTNVSNTISMEV